MKMFVKNIILFIISTVLLGSCEKVIDFPLKNTPPQPVAEAVINSLTHTASLTLSLTDDYYDTTGFAFISGAEAYIINEQDDTIVLNEMNPGYYIANQINIEENTRYRFEMDALGNHYRGISQMPSAVPVDSVYYTYSAATLFAPEGYRVWASFTDPPGEENYFRLKLYVNDVSATDGIFYLWKDTNADGEKVDFIFYRNALQGGDRIRVELWAIDKTTYDYYFALQNTSLQNQNASLAAPANPESNLTGGEIYGYFTAAAVSTSLTKTIEGER